MDLSDLVKNGPTGSVRKGCAWFLGTKPTFVAPYLMENLL